MGVMFDYPEDKVLSKRWVSDRRAALYGRTVCMVRSWAYGKMSIMIPFLPKALLIEFKRVLLQCAMDD